MGAIALEEIQTLHPAIDGETQHATFQADEFAIELVKLIDELLDPHVMQVQALQDGCQFTAQLDEALLQRRLRLLIPVNGLQPMHLHPVQALVGGRDVLEGCKELGKKRDLHGGERDVVLLAVHIVVRILPLTNGVFASIWHIRGQCGGVGGAGVGPHHEHSPGGCRISAGRGRVGGVRTDRAAATVGDGATLSKLASE